MKARSCCAETRHSSFYVRGRSVPVKRSAQWGAPALVLMLLPKCPMCVAAYMAMLTGIGMSFETAARLRGTVMVLCAGAMILLAARSMHRLIAAR
ncbi:hypothetical protein [Edaphobacter modestus]|uniref:Uncharacterized protein n=1 Tax=Edaphobacter modestus TaxID=388466 RepID=A0A4Q7YYD8_9BACT|nr:hypothetical protein [Edaphobacter modestus]RZU42992.1 hypothetical protein BDD14_4593 [Edaphobacter modestus]